VHKKVAQTYIAALSSTDHSNSWRKDFLHSEIERERERVRDSKKRDRKSESERERWKIRQGGRGSKET